MDEWEWRTYTNDQLPSLVDVVTGRLIAHSTRHTSDAEEAMMEATPLLLAVLQVSWTVSSEQRKQTESEAALIIAAMAAVRRINELREEESNA